MSDVISGGSEPPACPHRRPAALVAMLALLAGAVAGYATHEAHPASVAGRPHPAAEFAAGPARAYPADPTNPAFGLQPQLDDGLAGTADTTPLHERTGLQLYLVASAPGDVAVSLLRLDVDAHRRTAVPGVPARGRSALDVMPVRSGVVVSNGACAGCAPTPGALYLVSATATHRYPARGVVVPALDPAHLWLIGPDADAAGRYPIRQSDLAGHPVGASYRVPAGDTVVRAVTGGLLLVTDDRPPATVLWNPQTGTIGKRWGTYLTSSPSMLAWTRTPCGMTCQVDLTDLRTGVTRAVPAPEDLPPNCGQLSPDGRSLALCVTAGGTTGSRVVVYDTGTLRATPVPGVTLAGNGGTDGPLAASWSADSVWLVLTVHSSDIGDGGGSTTIALWRRGAARTQLAAIDPAQELVVPGGGP